MKNSAEEFTRQRVVVLHEQDSIYQGVRAMEQNNIGSVVVADADGDCQGIVTDRDIALNLATLGQDIHAPLRSIMSEPLIYVEKEDPWGWWLTR